MEITREQAGRFMLLKQGLLGSYRFYGKEGAGPLPNHESRKELSETVTYM